MDDSFIAKPLGRRQIDQAYPLVCAVAPGLAVDEWRAFAAAMLDAAGPPGARSGIMTVQNARGYLHGLFSYAIEPHLHHGRVLAVDNVVVLDLFDVPGVTATLLRAMDGLARGLGCGAIHTTLPEPASPAAARTKPSESPVAACFAGDGHRRETVRLCKRLPVVNDNALPAGAVRSDPGRADSPGAGGRHGAE